ncbi:hypothetical protein [Nocardia puris]|uniref:Uncharacterized protein n=1 Tax=Nocardia puris TaxID=208602 RepID=A0A366DMS0_9NOCA|nr:hypothetical protein [Nocardia puris]RBO91346.1 hypothetical protein DFR74_10448 [Nocardia puris]
MISAAGDPGSRGASAFLTEVDGIEVALDRTGPVLSALALLDLFTNPDAKADTGLMRAARHLYEVCRYAHAKNPGIRHLRDSDDLVGIHVAAELCNWHVHAILDGREYPPETPVDATTWGDWAMLLALDTCLFAARVSDGAITQDHQGEFAQAVSRFEIYVRGLTEGLFRHPSPFEAGPSRITAGVIAELRGRVTPPVEHAGRHRDQSGESVGLLSFDRAAQLWPDLAVGQLAVVRVSSEVGRRAVALKPWPMLPIVSTPHEEWLFLAQMLAAEDPEVFRARLELSGAPLYVNPDTAVSELLEQTLPDGFRWVVGPEQTHLPHVGVVIEVVAAAVSRVREDQLEREMGGDVQPSG